MVTQLRPTFYIKQGDTRPHLDVALADDEGHRVNLTNGTVSFLSLIHISEPTRPY